MNTPICDMLESAVKKARVRFCMPGHKGNASFLPADVLAYDVTELCGVDNLYAPESAIRDSQKLYAGYVGAKDSFFLTNGSSCGVQAAVLSVLQPEDTVIAARDFHLSAVHAFALAGVNTEPILPNGRVGDMYGVITPENVRNMIRQFPDAKAVYLTYPNYYGLCADLKAICDAVHAEGIPVICDAAHAAAFDYSEMLPPSPAESGCDIWVVSAHKTLPAPNQCAVLSIGENSSIRSEDVQRVLNALQTTSPSYMLLGVMDYALAFMRAEGKQRIAQRIEMIREFQRKTNKLPGYRCGLPEALFQNGAKTADPMKVVINVAGRGMSGFEALARLHQKGIEIETADAQNIVLICTVLDREEDFNLLYRALSEIEGSRKIPPAEWTKDLSGLFGGTYTMPIRKAFFANGEYVDLAMSEGRTATVPIGAYPPGIPLILPGQVMTEREVHLLAQKEKSGYELFGTANKVRVAAENRRGEDTKTI